MSSNVRMGVLLGFARSMSASAALAMILVSAGAGIASAEDTMKTLPGASCTLTGTGTPSVTSSAEAANSSASTQTFICPLVRGEQQLLGSASSNVWVTDRHYNADVCCSARSKDPGGQSLKFTSDQCSTGVQSNKKLDFFGPIASGTWSARFIQCVVPGTYSGNASMVLAYRSVEM